MGGNCQSGLNSRIRQRRTMETSTVTPLLLHFYHLLDMLQECVKFHRQSMTSLISRESA